MFQSIFRKWVVAAIAITIAILLILTFVISWLVQKDYYRQSLDQLNDRATSVENAYHRFLQSEITLSELRKEWKRMEQENNVSISIIGKKVKYLKQDLFDVGVRPDVKVWVSSVNEGNRVNEIARFRQQDGEKMLIVGFPLRMDNEVVASAFIYSPVTDVQQLAAPIRRSIWLVAVCCAGPLLILLWFATRRVVKPIQELSIAATAVSNGDFASRVTTKGNDEVARLGNSFNLMAERIERIEEQRRRLIMEMSHELRTPLTSIRGTLQAVADGILTDREQSEFIALSLQESERLGKLIDQIMELSAFEEHQIRFDFQEVDMNELVEQTAQQLKPKAEALGMRLKVAMQKDNAIVMRADPMRLRQALVNLIGNALDHNLAGTKILVKLFMNHQRVGISVQDDGQGIEPEHMPHLFERLYKAESSRSTRGSGLGLTISRHIVHAHGGKIHAESTRGKGTEIRVDLPHVRV
ncbi:HAMP domain-containing sensor histidine kinase [Cohnella lupini]|uniref:histidine kinase n=1 Tax=Cohnella lupini TaxID=1294267 RepID=A0A3D9ICC5_9BACL|nr:ATP-binding protein [Cohnella lupini]RED59199.1 signal transduction histidine kinase [Cohnella lupini]